jgi:hypothetical protein
MERRYFIPTGWSFLAAAALAVLLLTVAIAMISTFPGRDVDPFMGSVCAAIVTFVVLGHFFHRRRFSFDEATGMLTMQGELCFASAGHPLRVTLWHITQVELTERWNERTWYAVRIEVEGRRWFDVVSTTQTEVAQTALHEISDSIARAKQEHYRLAPDSEVISQR